MADGGDNANRKALVEELFADSNVGRDLRPQPSAKPPPPKPYFVGISSDPRTTNNKEQILDPETSSL